MSTARIRRAEFLRATLAKMGAPYVWGADGEDTFDCSGLVAFGLLKAGGPDWRKSHNCERFWKELHPTWTPRCGDLAFFGAKPNGASHVMIILPFGLVFGASGGNSTTTSVEAARAIKAKVKIFTDVNYRPDFLGFRKLPNAVD